PRNSHSRTILHQSFKAILMHLSDLSRKSIGIGTEIAQWLIMGLCSTPAMTAIIRLQTILHSLFGIGLPLTMNGGIDFIAGIYSLLSQVSDQFCPDHFAHIGKFVTGTAIRHIQVNWLGNSLLVLRLVEITQLQHTSQNPVAAL